MFRSVVYCFYIDIEFECLATWKVGAGYFAYGLISSVDGGMRVGAYRCLVSYHFLLTNINHNINCNIHTSYF